MRVLLRSCGYFLKSKQRHAVKNDSCLSKYDYAVKYLLNKIYLTTTTAFFHWNKAVYIYPRIQVHEVSY